MSYQEQKHEKARNAPAMQHIWRAYNDIILYSKNVELTLLKKWLY